MRCYAHIINLIVGDELKKKKSLEVSIARVLNYLRYMKLSTNRFETFNNGSFNSIGNTGLVTFSIDCWLPEFADKYYFAKSQMDPYLLINLWRNAMNSQIAIRCIMQRGTSDEILNWMVTVEDLKWHEDKVKDVKYVISLKEYRVVTV